MQSVSHLLYPSVEVDLSAIDNALAHHIPSLQVQQRLQGGWRLPNLSAAAGRRASVLVLSCQLRTAYSALHLMQMLFGTCGAGDKAGSGRSAGAEQAPGWLQLPAALLKAGRHALSW